MLDSDVQYLLERKPGLTGMVLNLHNEVESLLKMACQVRHPSRPSLCVLQCLYVHEVPKCFNFLVLENR